MIGFRMLVLLVGVLLALPVCSKDGVFEVMCSAVEKVTALDPAGDNGRYKALTVEQRAALYQKLQPAYQLLEQARLLPYTPHPVIILSGEESLRVTKFRRVFRLRLLQSAYFRDKGDYDAAFNACITGVEEAARIHAGGDTLTMLVSFEGQLINCIAAHNLLDEAISARQAGDAAKRLAAVSEKLPSLPESIDQDRRLQFTSLQQFAKNPDKYLGSDIYEMLDTGNRQRFRQELQAGVVEYDRIMRAWAENVKKDYPDWDKQQEVKTRLVEMLHIDLHKFSCMYLSTETTRHFLMTMLALKAYKAAHGNYPDALNMLVPDYLTRIPRDPFGHGDLQYRRTGDTYLLYSIGPDAVDNHGEKRLPLDKFTADMLGDISAP